MGESSDDFAQDEPASIRPLSFVVATASIIGTSVYLLLGATDAPRDTAALIAMVIVATIRIAAIYWGLKLPVFRVHDDDARPTSW